MLVVVLVLFTAQAASQQVHTIKGSVQDEKGHPLPGATVLLSPGVRGTSAPAGGSGTITSPAGTFILDEVPAGSYSFSVSFLGYRPFRNTLEVSGPVRMQITLQPEIQTLHEVLIEGNYAEIRQAESSLNLEFANEEFLRRHLAGSLMHSLDRLPGVDAIGIGAGQSKPVIRGLAFNRVVVVENGIRHEGQQWGSDHGLEVDQFAVDRAEVIKGPASLVYGPDALGGVIRLDPSSLPEPHTAGGVLDLNGATNNGLLGGSVRAFARGEKAYISLRGTLLDYGDYRVPADSVDIYSFRLPLHERFVRNTAGNERAFHLETGWKNNGFSNRLLISRTESMNGFFANAHGLEPRRVDTELHDKSSRDILYPSQEVNHWKVINRTSWSHHDWKVNADLGFQRNFRDERSEYVSHGYMPAVFPDTLAFSSDLERRFVKHTFSGNLDAVYRAVGGLKLTSGLQTEYQQNRIDGRGFIIPAFDQLRGGAFAVLSKDLSERSTVNAGIRFDAGRIATLQYLDWFPSQVDDGSGLQEDYVERSVDLVRTFSNLTWSAGYNLHLDQLLVRANLGKSFRMPIAKELSANGVNYHHFSYEVGDPDLSPEVAYQLDGGLEWHTRRFAVGMTPFFSYFPNYIYLNPGYDHDRSYGNGNQVFRYTESRVIRYGGEIHSHIQVHPSLRLGLIGEYLYSVQVSGEKEGFGLPFSPAPSMLLHLKYSREKAGLLLDPYMLLDLRLVAAQHRIVPPEESTPGYQLIHLGFGAKIPVKERTVEVSFQVRNLLNRNYFDHTSYYRLINLPEPGRNIVLNVSIPLSGKKGNREQISMHKH